MTVATLNEVTAWDRFCDLVEHIPNVVPVTEALVSPHFSLFPWDPVEPAEAMVEKAAWLIREQGCTTAYGHWDVDPRTSGHNLIPTKALAAAGITRAYTGHVHLPTVFTRDGVLVEVVGSMQPYAQGEDGGQGHIRYATLTLAELEAVDPASLSNTCVRLRLAPGEQFDGEPPNCLSWNVERVKGEDDEARPTSRWRASTPAPPRATRSMPTRSSQRSALRSTSAFPRCSVVTGNFYQVGLGLLMKDVQFTEEEKAMLAFLCKHADRGDADFELLST